MNYSTKWRDIPPDIPPMYRIFWRSPNLFKADICPIAATYALEPRKTVVGGNLARSIQLELCAWKARGVIFKTEAVASTLLYEYQ